MTIITWNTEFMSNIVLENDIIPNKYKLELELIPNTREVREQTIAFDRLQVFCGSILQSGMLCSIDNPFIEFLLEETASNILFLPDEPYEQTLVILLHSKLSAILEERFFLHHITLSSYLGEDIKYSFNLEQFEYPEIIKKEILENEKPWWARSDMSVMDIVIEDKETGEPKLEHQELNWEHINLAWDSNTEKEGKVIKVKSFKPKIVQGDIDKQQ